MTENYSIYLLAKSRLIRRRYGAQTAAPNADKFDGIKCTIGLNVWINIGCERSPQSI